jgi:lysozyme
MNPSSKCLDIIRKFEGFAQKPYLCPAGVPTIGYGSTRYADGRAVALGDPEITREQADAIMLATLASEYAPAVWRYAAVSLNQNEFDALVDFAYNAGTQALRTSTLLRKLNAGDRAGAADEFGRWVNANGKVLPGLVRRRECERSLFLVPA